jgi:hypothetical protein
MHCIAGVVITFVLLLNWVGITLHVSSHLWRVHAHYSPQLVEL